MSTPKKQKKYITSVNKPSVVGPNLVKSISTSPKVDIADILSKNKIQDVKSFMLESLLPNKNTISSDKKNFSKINIPIMNSSATSVVVSTPKEKVFSPFYNNYSKEMFQKLWLPPLTDSPDLITISLNGFSKSSEEKSFLSINQNFNPLPKNFQKTLCQSLQHLQPDITEAENIQVARKIRIYPSADQTKLFSKCFGATRYFYNKTVQAIKSAYETRKKKLRLEAKKTGCLCMIRSKNKTSGSKNCKSKTPNKKCGEKLFNKFFCEKHKKSKLKYGISLGFFHWRNKIITSNADLNKKDKWQEEIPYDTRQLIVKTVVGSFKSAITNLKNGNIKSFDIGFKSKKDRKQFFHMDHRSIKTDLTIWPQKLGTKIKMNKGEERWLKTHMKKNTLQDMQIVRQWPSKYYLIVPYVKEKSKEKPSENIVSIDPGVRTFGSFYDPDGVCGKVGDGLSKTILSICKKIDKLTSIMTKQKRKKKKNLKKRIAKLRRKIKNKVRDLHWKMANFYCKNYKTIVIPKLDIDSLIKANKKRKCSESVIRMLLGLSHGKFMEIIKSKSREYENQVLVVTEEYTSKTCGKCGILHENLGRAKVYKCGKCKAIIDRDINGARNILIKAMEKK